MTLGPSLLTAGRTRSVSPENPTGGKGAGGGATTGTGAAAARDLGPGWKISPSVEVPAGATHLIGDLPGPGVIRHLWCTTHPRHWRSLILRIHWDGASEPAVTEGGTLSTVTVAEATEKTPPALTLTRTVKTPSWPTRSNTAVAPPGPSKAPSLSRSHS